MLRLFDRHQVRKQKELSGLWDFSPVKENEVDLDKYSYQLNVPGCWEMHPDFLTYRGKGVYRREIKVTGKTNLRLVFKGVGHTADVFFDGEKIGHHYNAYTPFDFIVKDVKAGEHVLKVLVDNSFSDESALHTPNDYYSYGGLTRAVAVEEIDEVYIKRVEFTPYQEEGQWKASVVINLKNLTDKSLQVLVKGVLGDKYELNFGENDIEAAGNLRLEKEFSFPGVKSWSAEQPKLYSLETNLYLINKENKKSSAADNQKILVDDLIERVGFRVIEVEGKKLLLNGKEIKLRGFNRHEDHPMTGSAIPFALMKKDIDLMEDMGANTVRTSHYPNDELFLDLCDERGILVWEENHARGFNLEQMQNPNFAKQCADCNQEMVENHINHPAIIIWGILNECASETKEGREHYRRQFEQIKSMDQSRPLTFATCRHFNDISLDLVDIVSVNIYSGWYDTNDAADYYQREKEWIEESGGANKPIIISEFGAGAIYGFREPTRVKWTEERQQDLLKELLSYYMKQEEIVGTLIWQFSDCRVSEDGISGKPGTSGKRWFNSRPRSKNNKGIVDEYRRPKLAYQTVKKYFNDEK